jgi:ribonuclease HI
MDKVIVYCDGGSRGNPGPAALGVVIKTINGEIIEEIGEYLGEQTNNYAEYSAVLTALNKLRAMKVKSADFYLDSELVVQQLKGIYKVKNEGLKVLYSKVLEAIGEMNITFTHVYRKDNVEADAIVNQVLDSQK